MPPDAAQAARCGGRDVLAAALADSRARTLALLDTQAAALGETLPVPYSPQLNPPLWEAGHVGWFQDWWIARNRQRDRGPDCEPDHARPPGRLAGADALYDSSRVAHSRRWHLPLPDLAATRAYLAAGLEETLALLAQSPETDAALYFYRLALFHEDMHGEAGIYMAQALDIPLPNGSGPEPARLPETVALALPAQAWSLGWSGPGFAFDNELAAHPVAVDAFEIDSQPVSWRRYLACVEATEAAPPRYLRRPARPGKPAASAPGRPWTWTPPPRISPGRRPRPGAAGRVGACPARRNGNGPPSPGRISAGARCGNGPPAASSLIQASNPTPTGTTPRPGSATVRCCAAPASPPRRAWPIPATATTSRRNATMFTPGFAAARFRGLRITTLIHASAANTANQSRPSRQARGLRKPADFSRSAKSSGRHL